MTFLDWMTGGVRDFFAPYMEKPAVIPPPAAAPAPPAPPARRLPVRVPADAGTKFSATAVTGAVPVQGAPVGLGLPPRGAMGPAPVALRRPLPTVDGGDGGIVADDDDAPTLGGDGLDVQGQS